jgi:hypothetical protein
MPPEVVDRELRTKGSRLIGRRQPVRPYQLALARQHLPIGQTDRWRNQIQPRNARQLDRRSLRAGNRHSNC